MQVTEKGQVTIPKPMRERLGILPGSDVDFEVHGDSLVLRKSAASDRGHRLVERIRGRGDAAMSTDELLALTRAR